MSSSGTELVLGAQSRAATIVLEEVGAVRAALQTLADTLQTHQTGFNGGAAAGFYDAVTCWFEVASELAPALEQYAANLVAVDVTEHQADQAQQQAFDRLSARLGPS